MLGGFSYLEDITLYPGDSRSVEDDCEQSNTAESCSLGATIYFVLTATELANANALTGPKPRPGKPESSIGCQLPNLDKSSLTPSRPLSRSRHPQADQLHSPAPARTGKTRVASTYSEMACLPVIPATWGWKPYLIAAVH